VSRRVEGSGVRGGELRSRGRVGVGRGGGQFFGQKMRKLRRRLGFRRSFRRSFPERGRGRDGVESNVSWLGVRGGESGVILSKLSGEILGDRMLCSVEEERVHWVLSRRNEFLRGRESFIMTVTIR
jgi:hypothetical protein